jgi:hypothetical protein
MSVAVAGCVLDPELLTQLLKTLDSSLHPQRSGLQPLASLLELGL